MELKKKDKKIINLILRRLTISQLIKFKNDLKAIIIVSQENKDIENEEKYQTYLYLVEEEEERRIYKNERNDKSN